MWILTHGTVQKFYLTTEPLQFFDQQHLVYVKRIVAARKGGGVGRRALLAFAESVFAERAAPYLWLNVHRENLRGQRCYLAIGFVDFDLGAPELERHNRAAGNTASGRALPMILHRDAFDRSC